MPISDGINQLKRIAFQLGDKFFRFALNPESIIYSRPHRSTAVKTKTRIVIEDFQSDVPFVTISGSTGFNPTGKSSDRGFAKIKEMKNFLEKFGEMGGNGNTATDDFYFHDFTNDESYVVVFAPEGVTYTQDVSSPLTYKYEIKFYILRRASQPSEDSVVDPEIGSRYPTTPGGPGGQIEVGGDGTDNDVTPYDPSSGNNNVYNQGSTSSSSSDSAASRNQVVNPQAPSTTSYAYGTTGLGYIIGYYAGGGN